MTGKTRRSGAIAVTGGSQGGALSIVTAGLDRRVTRLVAYYPALSDVTGYVNQRAGGWPHMFRATEGPNVHRDEAKIATTRYYDVVNFARRVTAHFVNVLLGHLALDVNPVGARDLEQRIALFHRRADAFF